MKKALLDTDIFSELLKNKNLNVRENAITYFKQFDFYTISTITVFEIIKGFHKNHQEIAIQKFLDFSNELEIISSNLKSATLAGRIYADLERTGQLIGCFDPLIASIAIEQNLVLVTGNFKHYQRIQLLGYPLELSNWR